MLPKNLFTNLPLWICLLPYLWGVDVAADSIKSTRIGADDWICADEQSVRLSGHQRLDKAIEACANRALADGKLYRVIPAHYTVEASIDAPGTTEPPIDPEPDPPTDVVLGSVNVQWAPPTQNTDGSPLTDLFGYRLYWGALSDAGFSGWIRVSGAATSSYEIADLPVGWYRVAITALAGPDSSDLIESAYSNVVEKEAAP